MAQFHYAQNNPGSRIRLDGAHERTDTSERFLWRLVLLSAVGYLVWSGKLTIVFNPGPAPESSAAALLPQPAAQPAAMSMLPETTEKPRKSRNASEVSIRLPDGDLNNVTLAIDPDFAARNDVPDAKRQRYHDQCRQYLERYAPVAIAEMQRFGIPASITLAQGLLESNAGESKLARTTNNHFGIKCFSKKCRKGHCANFTDDTHKDFFLKYANVWSSYRSHSLLLKNNKRYARLFDLEPDDYRSWARGLARAGYASDKQYGEKLIAIIQNLGLDRYDKTP